MVIKKPKIVIIGAGLAGLTAAYRLHSVAGNHIDLSIIESSNRIGGRILTSQFAGDRVEMGATWIHGITGSPIHAIADTHHLLTDPHQPWERMDGFPQNPITVLEGGAVINDAVIVRPITTLYNNLMDAARSGDSRADIPGVGAYLRRGFHAAVADNDGVAEAVFRIHENLERTCTSADDLDNIDLVAESEYQDLPGEHVTIGMGFSSIVDHLAAAIPRNTLFFNTRISKICWNSGSSSNPVTIGFDNGSVMVVDHVIVTVSLGVLQAGLRNDARALAGLCFSPPLPPFKTDAINRLGFGVVNKLFMQLDCADNVPFLQLAFKPEPPPATAAALIPGWMRRTASIAPIYTGSKTALAWLAGVEAAAIEAVDDDNVVDGVQATLNGFGYEGIRVKGVKRSGWGGDPNFLGSYSYVAVGSGGDDLDAMAEPLPRGGKGEEGPALQVLFAGEATDRTHYSTTHGAYFSGMREADRLLKHYGFSS